MHGEPFRSVPISGDEEPAEDEVLLTVEETAARLANITPRHLRNLEKQGEIEKVNIGRRVGYVRSSVNAYIKRLRQEAGSAA